VGLAVVTDVGWRWETVRGWKILGDLATHHHNGRMVIIGYKKLQQLLMT